MSRRTITTALALALALALAVAHHLHRRTDRAAGELAGRGPDREGHHE